MNVFIVCSVFSLRMYSCLGKGECDVTAMSHVTAKVSCDGAANYRKKKKALLHNFPEYILSYLICFGADFVSWNLFRAEY